MSNQSFFCTACCALSQGATDKPHAKNQNRKSLTTQYAERPRRSREICALDWAPKTPRRQEGGRELSGYVMGGPLLPLELSQAQISTSPHHTSFARYSEAHGGWIDRYVEDRTNKQFASLDLRKGHAGDSGRPGMKKFAAADNATDCLCLLSQTGAHTSKNKKGRDPQIANRRGNNKSGSLLYLLCVSGYLRCVPNPNANDVLTAAA